MKNTKAKTAKDENFPVGMLISKKLRPLVKAYYQAARMADDIADNPALNTQQKKAELEKVERAFFGKNTELEYTAAADLGKLFKLENLDNSLYTDLLVAFNRDAENKPLEIWEQLVDYCNYSAAPVGRFMLAIHDENPSTYLPAAALCAVLQISNHLQDIKADAICLKRFYFPSQMLEKYNVAYNDFFLTFTTPALRLMIDDVIEKLRGMLKDARPLKRLVKNRRLRMELGVIFSLTNSMLKRLEEGDVLKQKICLSRWDWIKAVVYGFKTMLWRD